MSVGPEPTRPVAPAPTRRVTTVRNVRRIRFGIGLAAAALVIVLIGALLQFGVLASQVLRPTARGDVGEAVTFDAEARRYDLILDRTDLDLVGIVERAADRTECELTLADGSTATVRGARQVASSETSFGSTIGYFDAVAGPTTVRCDHNVSDGVLLGGYTVAASRQPFALAATAMIGAGVVLGIAASVLVSSGMRGKAVIIDTVS